jgi:hypothetical protein
VPAGQFARDHADHQAFEALHLVIGDGGFGVGVADAGIVGEEEELAAGQEGARAHDELAGLVVAAARNRVDGDAFFAQAVGGGHGAAHVLGVGRGVGDQEDHAGRVVFAPADESRMGKRTQQITGCGVPPSGISVTACDRFGLPLMVFQAMRHLGQAAVDDQGERILVNRVRKTG